MSNLKSGLGYIYSGWRQLMSRLGSVLRGWLRPLHSQRLEGQAMVEYALLIGLIALVVIGILVLLGPSVGSVFSGINGSVRGCSTAANDPSCPQDISAYPTPGIILTQLSNLF